MRLNINHYHCILGEKGLKNEDVCKYTGLSEKSLNWILENQYIEVSTLERIAEAIGCSFKEISLSDYTDVTENVIEWEKDNGQATVTLSQKRMITRVKKLADKFPRECHIVAENKDGSICAHIPTSWIRINPNMELSEEQRKKKAEIMRRNISHIN